MRPHRKVRVALLIASATVGANAALAQQPVSPATSATPVAMTSRADSMTELDRLDARITAHKDDAAAWHARGLLAWQLSQGMRAIGNRVNGQQLRLNMAADSSLVAAVTLEPTNVRFLVDFATYRSQGSAIVRGGATRYITRAFEAARAAGDSLAVAKMADMLGQLEFKYFQMFFGRRMALANGPGIGIADILAQQSGDHPASENVAPFSSNNVGSVSNAVDLVRQSIEQRSVAVGGDPPPGAEAYDRALHYFEEATSAAPALPLPWRHRFAALADRKRWEELEAAARARLALAPWDPDAWLALGLSLHRTGLDGAMTAFDSAFAQMSDSTRRRLDRVERIMRPKAVKALDALPPEARARTARFVWTAADPLWSVPGNEVRAEYLARVAFAELRFTDEEAGLHGVDTYPGDLHVRYGFPKYTTNWECSDEFRRDVCWYWWYAPRVQFVVRYVAAFNRGMVFNDDIALNEDVQYQAPAVWTDIPGVPKIDSIPLRVARFRPDGTRPSVVVTGVIPLLQMATGGVRPTVPTVRLWMIADGADAVARDSTRADAGGLALWKLRVPSGDLYARAEAVTPGAGAARGTIFAPGVGGAPGLAMSDVLIATSATDGTSPALRWHELVIAPAPDALPRGRGFAVAWETYGLGIKDGSQHYAVRLVLEKGAKSLAGRIVAQIGGLVGTQRGNEKVTLGFERTGAARDVALDHVALSLSEAPAGRYKLTVEITDLNAHTTTRRSTTLLIGP